jgi:microcystin-dependent protein
MNENSFIGELKTFPYHFVPKGWAACEGQKLRVVDEQALFSVIGTTYGGDGVTTFALPDLRNRVVIGSSSSHPLGHMGGEQTVALTNDTMPSHTHLMQASNSEANSASPEGNIPAKMAAGQRGRVTPAPAYSSAEPYPEAMHEGTVAPSGLGDAHINEQPFMVTQYCICIDGVFPPRS